MAIPVILDTDLGTDIDDTWALAQVLRTPELDLRLVSACTGDTAYRGRLVAGVLAAGGRADVPIALGPPGGGLPGAPQEAWPGAVDLADHPGGVADDGVAAMIDAVLSADEVVTIVAIGPLTNLAAALEREPSIVDRARVVGMQGSWRVGYKGGPGPVPEYNVAVDVPAARRVIGASWDVLLTPLDTCGDIELRDDRYRAVLAAADGDALAAACVDNYRVWAATVGAPDDLAGRRTTTLYDTVAVHLAHDRSLVEVESVDLSIDDDGTFRPGGSRVDLATSWRDRDAFLDDLTRRLTTPG